jgi:hypothetical protein
MTNIPDVIAWRNIRSIRERVRNKSIHAITSCKQKNTENQNKSDVLYFESKKFGKIIYNNIIVDKVENSFVK